MQHLSSGLPFGTSVCVSNSLCLTNVSPNGIQIREAHFLRYWSHLVILTLTKWIIIFSWKVNTFTEWKVHFWWSISWVLSQRESNSITRSISEPIPVKSLQIGALKVTRQKTGGWASGWLFAWVNLKNPIMKKKKRFFSLLQNVRILVNAAVMCVSTVIPGSSKFRELEVTQLFPLFPL